MKGRYTDVYAKRGVFLRRVPPCLMRYGDEDIGV